MARALVAFMRDMEYTDEDIASVSQAIKRHLLVERNHDEGELDTPHKYSRVCLGNRNHKGRRSN